MTTSTRPDTDKPIARIDPRTAYPRPPYPRITEPPSGSFTDMDPRPDHGEASYVGRGRLTGLKTLITGGDSGIGRAAAIAFAREGADVAIGYRDQDGDAEDTLRLIEDAGREGMAVAGDLGDEAHCHRLIESVGEAFGRIDVLVNNAATQRRRDDPEDVPTAEWERIVRTNLTAPFWLCQDVVRWMEPGGSIINVASIQATQPSASLLAYATTKGGLVTFSKALAESLMEDGIRVNVVAPGPVWTPLVATTSDPDHLVEFGGDTFVGRAAQPAELAEAFVFLASPGASYITGAVIPVTGGEFFA
jgi:NAD(P)-dependent dehydrogenase (short-subunit alcohol dehydrogenase family)